MAERPARHVWRELVLSPHGPSPSARLVACAFAEFVNVADGEAWPSVGRLAVNAGVSERQVTRMLAELVDGGWLVQVRPGGVRGGGRTTRYRVSTPDTVSGVVIHMSDRVSGVTSDMSSGVGDTTPDICDTTPDIWSTTPDTVSPESVITSWNQKEETSPVDKLRAELGKPRRTKRRGEGTVAGESSTRTQAAL